ncbi:MAG TPA: hypothetical protein VJH34_02540 [archaeon]|nr:hypothetical protein [archaeon]
MAKKKKTSVQSFILPLIKSLFASAGKEVVKTIVPIVLTIWFTFFGLMFLGFALEGYLEYYFVKNIAFLIVAIVYFIIALIFKWRWVK